jgi:hypothetical protein
MVGSGYKEDVNNNKPGIRPHPASEVRDEKDYYNMLCFFSGSCTYGAEPESDIF